MSEEDSKKSTYYPGLQKIVPGKNKAISNSEIVVNEEGVICKVSNSFLKDSGYMPEEVDGIRLADFLHPSELKNQDLINCLKNSNGLPVLLRVKIKNRQYIGFLVSLDLKRNEKE